MPIHHTPGSISTCDTPSAPVIIASTFAASANTSTPLVSIVGGTTASNSRAQLLSCEGNNARIVEPVRIISNETRQLGASPHVQATSSTRKVTAQRRAKNEVDPTKDGSCDPTSINDSCGHIPGEISVNDSDSFDVTVLPGSTPGGRNREKLKSKCPTLPDSSEEFQESPLPRTPERPPKTPRRPLIYSCLRLRQMNSFSSSSEQLLPSSNSSAQREHTPRSKSIIVTRSMATPQSGSKSTVRGTPSRRGNNLHGKTPSSNKDGTARQELVVEIDAVLIKSASTSSSSHSTLSATSRTRDESGPPTPRHTANSNRKSIRGKSLATRPPLASRPAESRTVEDKPSTSSRNSGTEMNVSDVGVSSLKERESQVQRSSRKRRIDDEDSDVDSGSALRKRSLCIM